MLSLLLVAITISWIKCIESTLPTTGTEQETSLNRISSRFNITNTNRQYELPTSWAIPDNRTQDLKTTNSCVMLTSPTVGVVYQSLTALSIHWQYDHASVHNFEDSVNATFTLSLTWIDNYANKTSIVADNIDPTNGVFLWKLPYSVRFNKRLYIVLQSHWSGLSDRHQKEFDTNPSLFEATNGLACYNKDQIAGPFTVMNSQLTQYFLVTSPDPGVQGIKSIAQATNSDSLGQGLLYNVPIGKLLTNMYIPITWYCSIPDIATIDLYLDPVFPRDSSNPILIAQGLQISSARYNYRVPSNNSQLSPGYRFRILMYGYTTNKDNNTDIIVTSWASDGPYTIDS